MRRRPRHARRSKQRGENLELRCLLSTITVTSDGDDVANDGLVTLREAVQAANTNQSVDGSAAGSADEVDVIEFANGIGSINLGGEQFEVSDSVHIRGPESKVTLDAQSLSRHIVVVQGADAFTLENMRLVNGQSSEGTYTGAGGSVLVSGPASFDGVDLTVTNSDFVGNASVVNGGAIQVWDRVTADSAAELSRITVTDSSFIGNSAASWGGAILVGGNTETRINRSTFSNNSATEDGNGGGIAVWDSVNGDEPTGDAFLWITDSDFTGNASRWNGGAISYQGDGTAQIDATVASENSSDRGDAIYLAPRGTGASAFVTNSTLSENSGVALYFEGPGQLTVSDSTVSRNEGSGIIGREGKVQILGSTVADNFGSGIRSSGPLTVGRTAVLNNESPFSRGIQTDSDLNLTSSTVTGSNNAVEALGSRIEIVNATISATTTSRFTTKSVQTGHGSDVSIHNSTIVGPMEIRAASLSISSSIIEEVADFAGSVEVSNSIIERYAGDGLTPAEQWDDSGNLIGTADAPVDAGLTTLGVIGSDSTPVYALRPDSQAIDRGANVTGLVTDVLGQSRVRGSGPDIGALEGVDVGIVYVDGLVFGEDADIASIKLRYAGQESGSISVAYETRDGSAQAGDDYAAVSGTVQLAGQDGAVANVNVPILQETTELEPDETFAVVLETESRLPGVFVPFGHVDVTITDDETTGAYLLPGGLLKIQGTDGDDNIRILQTVRNRAKVVINGRTYPLSGPVAAVDVDAYEGNDIIDFSKNNPTTFRPRGEVRGGPGNDTIIGVEDSFSFGLTLVGGDGDDYLEGGFAQLGGDGNDRLVGGREMRGGPGNDTIHGSGSMWGDAGDDVLVSTHPRFAIQAWGGDGNDQLVGGPGKDTLHGEGGDDSLFGRSGNDSLVGGDGADTLIGGPDRDSVRGDSGNDVLLGNAGRDTLLGGLGDDSVDGGDGDDRLDGSVGNDTLRGGNGADRIETGEGENLVYGGPDRDSIFSGAGADTVRGGGGDDRIELKGGHDKAWGGHGNDAIFGGRGQDTLIGGAGDDSLDGADGADRIIGGPGHDRILGGRGDNSLSGGAGNDFVSGGVGVTNGGTGNDEVWAEGIVNGGAGDDTLRGQGTLNGGEGDDHIWAGGLLNGGNGNDILRGYGSDDRLSGGDGRDFLVGSAGRDTLIGGAGDDLLLSTWLRHDVEIQLLAAEWFSTDRDYRQRSINVRGGARQSNDRLNLGNYLRTAGQSDATIHPDDDAGDVLIGGDGLDLFFARKETAIDRVFRDANEILARL